MLNDLLVAFGVKASVIPKLWERPAVKPDEKASGPYELASRLSAVHSTLDFYKRQLLPGEKLEKFSGILMGHLNESLNWESLAARFRTVTPGRINQVSLKDLCGEILVDAITKTLFGNRIYETAPGLVQNLLDFNDDAWMLIFHYPQGAASKLNKARQKILKAFLSYIQAPQENRSDQAWLIEQVMMRQRAAGIDEEDQAALLLMIYWA